VELGGEGGSCTERRGVVISMTGGGGGAKRVTVDGTDGSILEAVPVGEQTNFTQQDGIMDLVTFERILDEALTDLDVNSKYFPSVKSVVFVED